MMDVAFRIDRLEELVLLLATHISGSSSPEIQQRIAVLMRDTAADRPGLFKDAEETK